MDQERRDEIQERVEKRYAELKERHAHHSMLRDRTIGGYAPRPSPQLIEASIGETPKTDRQLKQQARDHVAGELKTERKLEAKRRNLQNNMQSRKSSNQNSGSESVDPKEQKRQALRNKLKRDHEQARQRGRSV